MLHNLFVTVLLLGTMVASSIAAHAYVPVIAGRSPDETEAASQATSGSPADHLPAHIRQLTWFGERADWSHDGKRVLFLSKTFGDAMEIDLATKVIRNLTAHYPHHGYTRALYLSNGDILLSGPEAFDPKRPGDARVQCYLYVLDKSLTKPPVPLGTKCSEGPAVSRKRMHIAWTHVSAEYPEEMPAGSSRMQEADIVYEGGKPELANQRLILDSRDLPFQCTLETQNFRPPEEKELTFSAYGYQGTDVCGVDLVTKKVTDYSNSPGQYDEPEGIYPDGQYTLVECDKQNHLGSGHVDLWKLKLDGSGAYERLTYFSDYPGYKASNPVVSDDGRFIAFQMAKSNEAAGVGRGLFVYDIARSKRSSKTTRFHTTAKVRRGQGDKTPALPGWKLVWSDEFNRDGPPDPKNWKFEKGFVRNEEAQWYQEENARCKDGMLVIEGRRERRRNPNYVADSTDWHRNRAFAEYTSSSIKTEGLHAWQYGRFEMRARIDTRSGLWPAFWTLGVNGDWPSNGEIDIMEFYRGNLLANVAWGTDRRWTAKWHSTSRPITQFNDPDWSSKFHLWRMDWDENAIRLYVDEMLLNETLLKDTVNGDGSGKNPFHQPHYILLNLAIGGQSGGDPSSTEFPARFEVDYVRVYQKATK